LTVLDFANMQAFLESHNLQVPSKVKKTDEQELFIWKGEKHFTKVFAYRDGTITVEFYNESQNQLSEMHFSSINDESFVSTLKSCIC
jgi:hypothetical protein